MKAMMFAACCLMATAAEAATFAGSFQAAAASGAANTLSGTFRITFDSTQNRVDDRAFDDLALTAGFASGAPGFTMDETVATRFDTATAPFSIGARDFIFGFAGASQLDTNNTTSGANGGPDFLFRAVLDSNLDLIFARGTVRRGSNVWTFDTENGVGSASFAIAQVPEPASWAMLISGFGLTGAIMRRRRSILA